MKLPSWLTGTKTDILPDPSTHVDLAAEDLAAYIEQGGRFHLVAFPGDGARDTEIRPIDGRWPLIVDASLERDTPLAYIVAEDRQDAAYYLNPADMVTVAPA